MKLATKISLSIITLTILVSLGLSIFIFNIVRSTLEEAIGQNQLQTTQATMQNIDRILYERYLDIQDYAGSVIIEKYLTGNASLEDVERRSEDFFNHSGPWDRLEIWDKNQSLIFSSAGDFGDKLINTNQKKDLFNQALRENVFVSDVVISDDTGKPTIYFVAPVKNINQFDKSASAVAVGQFAWQAIEEIINNSVKEPAEIHLFSQQGVMIATNKDRKYLFNESLKYLSENKTLENKAIVGVSDEGEKSVLRSHVSQLGYLGYKGSGWEMLVELPSSIAFASANLTSWNIISLLLMFMFIEGMFLIIIFNNLVVQPIAELDRVTNDIFAGRLNVRARLTSKDEIGKLANVFNKMLDDVLNKNKELAQIRDGLAVSVKERTAELEKSQQKFKLIFESSNDAIMTLEPPSWKFTSANPATIKMFGCKSEKEFTSLGPWDLSPEIQPDGELSDDKSKAMIKKAMAEGYSFFSWTHKKCQGGNFPASVLLSRIIEDGKTYLQSTVRDLSDLEISKQKLEEEIKLRTIQVQKANDKLSKQKILLEEEVEKRTEELNKKVFELQRFNKLTTGRELKILELKEEILKLKGKG